MKYQNYALAVASTVVFFGLVEGSLSLVDFNYEPRKKNYYHPTLGGFLGTQKWTLATRLVPPDYIWVALPNTPLSNSYGFRNPELPLQKEPGKVRVAFLGGSTTQGEYRSYPSRAIDLINRAIGREVYEPLNMACSAYTTHQSLIALRKWGLPHRPDKVFVYHGWNDPGVRGGYSDHENDGLADAAANPYLARLARVRTLRTGQLMARFVDWSDRGWPRPRVTPERFRENLDAIVRECARAGIPVWIAVRPHDRTRPISRHWIHSDPLDLGYYRALFGTDHRGAMYDGIHQLYSTVQKEVAAASDNAELYDLYHFVNQLQTAERQGALGPNLRVFRDDACHLYEFADQKVAEFVAPIIAPEYRAEIAAHIQSFDYHQYLAQQFVFDALPHAALYHIARAAEIAPARTTEVAELRARAVGDTLFTRLFTEGQWRSGSTFEEKMPKLHRCLEMRPSDFGVLWQAYYLSVLTDRVTELAGIIRDFHPLEDRHHREWLRMTLESHIAGERWEQAITTAYQLREIDPENPKAAQFLSRVEWIEPPAD